MSDAEVITMMSDRDRVIRERDALIAALSKEQEFVRTARELRIASEALLKSRNFWRGFSFFQLGLLIWQLFARAL